MQYFYNQIQRSGQVFIWVTISIETTKVDSAGPIKQRSKVETVRIVLSLGDLQRFQLRSQFISTWDEISYSIFEGKFTTNSWYLHFSFPKATSRPKWLMELWRLLTSNIWICFHGLKTLVSPNVRTQMARFYHRPSLPDCHQVWLKGSFNTRSNARFLPFYQKYWPQWI